MSMRVDEILEALPEVGLRLTNLFQSRYELAGNVKIDGWQANVSADGTCYQFGRGETPILALQAALKASGVDLQDDGT